MAHSRLRFLSVALAAGYAAGARAHHPASGVVDPWAWNFEPWVVALLAIGLLLYVAGVRRLWARAGYGRGVSRRAAGFFAAGWTVLVVALLSPVDTLGGALFSMHMVQHELLMVVAAPLLVLSRPLEAWAWGLPRSWLFPLAGIGRWSPLALLWRAVTDPAGAWVFHAAALWVWHVPMFFEAGLRNEAWHALQHASFLASALAFWWTVLAPRGAPDGFGMASAFTTMLHTGALGALLTFAPYPWYRHYGDASALGLSPLEDQQLGGLVMWVVGSTPYLAAGLFIAAGWLVVTADRNP